MTYPAYRSIASHDFMVSTNEFLSFVIHDKSDDAKYKHLEHVYTKDYFSILAMFMELLAEREKSAGRSHTILDNVKKELLYLNEHYDIVKKET